MGCPHSRQFHKHYSVKVNSDEKVEGESHIYRAPAYKDGLVTAFRDDPNVRTVKDLYMRAFDKFADQPFLGMRTKEAKDKMGPYEFKTYKEVKEIAQQIGSAIVNLHLAPPVKEGDMENRFIGIYAKNSEQWIELDIACTMYNMVSVPIYATLGPEIVKFILEQTKLQTIFCSEDHVKELIDGASEHGYHLKNVVSFGESTSEQDDAGTKANIRVLSWEDMIFNGRNKPREPVDVQPEGLYTICYTSGTTGTPKGAMLSHKAQTSSIAATMEREDLEIDENDCYYSYLPLAHCMERSGILYMVSKGTKIGFASGDKRKMKEDLQELKPSIMFGVPKVWNTIYEGIKKQFDGLTGLKKATVETALKVKLFNLKTRGKYTHPLYDRLVFNKVRESMGGRLRYAATGAAPLDPEVLNFLRVALCIPIVEGYGPTEGCAITFLSNARDPSSGQVGGPMGCLEFKVKDEKDMKYTSEDKDKFGRSLPRGEVMFRGSCAFDGYYKQPEKTADNLTKDGWVMTGDIGQINHDGSLTILDKKKSFFKLSQGEYVAGDKVEAVYKDSKFVNEMLIHGDSSKNFLVAIVVPKKEEIEKLAAEMNLEDSYEKLLEKKEIKEKVLKEMNGLAKEKKLNGFEMARQLHLSSKTFKELDLMTPTEKLKRNEAKEKLKDQIEQMYKDGPLDGNK